MEYDLSRLIKALQSDHSTVLAESETTDPEHDRKPNRDIQEITVADGNIGSLRQRYPDGLHFVVGDTHTQCTTLRLLMEKIRFDPAKDHVYFVGDYNSGGDPTSLLGYISQYFQEDYSLPGFHMIRGNHERELSPWYALANLPDVIVLKGRIMNYYIAHAGMVRSAFDLINADMAKSPDEKVYAYAFDENVTSIDAPFAQVVWSRNGLYARQAYNRIWPTETALFSASACIIHGHTPFSMLRGYGGKTLFWKHQRVWFSEELQSFDIDSNVKGRYTGDPYRGLSCVCLELLDEIGEKGRGILKRENILQSENFVFSMPYAEPDPSQNYPDLLRLLKAAPKARRVGLGSDGNPQALG